MPATTNEQATDTNTVTVMVGSDLEMDQMVSSGVIPSLVADGDVGLDAYDNVMAAATLAGPYGNNLVTQLASAWAGAGTGIQEMSETSGISSGFVQLTNTTNATIYVPAQGALFYAADGSAYQTEESPTNPAWTNGVAQTGSGSYAITPGQSVAVSVEATFVGDDLGSDSPGSIVKSSIAGLTVSQPNALVPGGSYSVARVSVTTGGNYYMNGAAYTPTVSFSVAPSGGTTATGHVTGLYVAGEGGLGSAGSGYKVAKNVAVEDSNGDTLFTINITSVAGNGAITGITLNQTNQIDTFIPANLTIVQAGATGGTMTGTNFGIASAEVDNGGTGYATVPTVTFSSAGSAPAASGTLTASNSVQTGWLSNNKGDYTNVFTDQGLAPAEAYVNVGPSNAWTPTDVTAWQSYVQGARSVGILNLAPVVSAALSNEDPAQPFATSAFYSGIRQAALYGGGLEIELPSFSVFAMTPTQWETVIEEVRWSQDNGIRSSLLIENQGDAAGDTDPNFASNAVTILQQLQAEGALPSQVELENDSTTSSGSYYDTNPSDVNSLNAAALDVASDFTLTPTASEDGLEVKGASKAQTTLIMTGIDPSEDVVTSRLAHFAAYGSAQIFEEDPSKSLTLTITDTSGLLSLSDSLNGASVPTGDTLTFTGLAAQATAFLNDLNASASATATGVANLQLTLTDSSNESTVGTTAVYLGDVHPTFSSITETPSSAVNNIVAAGDTVTFTVATSAPVTVSGLPELVLTNQQIASYVGQDQNGNLLFSYYVEPGDDTAALRVRGIVLDGATITNTATGLAVNPDSIDAPEAAMANPLVVNTATDTIVAVTLTSPSPGSLGIGNEITFALAASKPITSVDGTPTLQLNDGGTAFYSGLSNAGQIEFSYLIPTGGAYAGLAATSLNLNGAMISEASGESVLSPNTLPSASSTFSYDATASNNDIDTLVIALSADEYAGDAIADITVNGQEVCKALDVSAVHSAGQTQLLTIMGNFGSGVDQLGISFTNDLWAGTPTTDRNLYIDGVNFDGMSELGSTELNQTSALVTPIAPVQQDKLQLWVAEDAGGGNAMFSVQVDGNALPGTYSTDVAYSSGQWQEVDIYGNFGVGAHTITVTDMSGAWDGTSDNGLYVEQAAVDGMVAPASTQGLYSPGSADVISVAAPATDVLTLKVSEDAFEGDAQCYVTIDGKIFGGVTTVTASHAAGVEQTITIDEAGLSSGAHTVGLAFINDLWGGTSTTDRNLYLDSVQLNGVDQQIAAALPTWGTASFQVGQVTSHAVAMSNITSLLTGAANQIAVGTTTPKPTSLSAISNLHVVQSAVQPVTTFLSQT